MMALGYVTTSQSLAESNSTVHTHTHRQTGTFARTNKNSTRAGWSSHSNCMKMKQSHCASHFGSSHLRNWHLPHCGAGTPASPTSSREHIVTKNKTNTDQIWSSPKNGQKIKFHKENPNQTNLTRISMRCDRHRRRCWSTASDEHLRHRLVAGRCFSVAQTIINDRCTHATVDFYSLINCVRGIVYLCRCACVPSACVRFLFFFERVLITLSLSLTRRRIHIIAYGLVRTNTYVDSRIDIIFPSPLDARNYELPAHHYSHISPFAVWYVIIRFRFRFFFHFRIWMRWECEKTLKTKCVWMRSGQPSVHWHSTQQHNYSHIKELR